MAFKRKAKITWASPKQVNELVDQLCTAWEDSKYTDAKVLAKARLVLDDAHSGELQLEGNNVYAVKLWKSFQAIGIEIPKSTEASVPTSISKYA